MALHTHLPIYKTGCDLVALAVRAQAQMPREVKRSLGEKICHHCIEMVDLMAMANATQRAERALNIERLLSHRRTLELLLRVSHERRYVSTAIWADSMQLLESIGRQGGGWLKSVHNKAPAA